MMIDPTLTQPVADLSASNRISASLLLDIVIGFRYDCRSAASLVKARTAESVRARVQTIQPLLYHCHGDGHRACVRRRPRQRCEFLIVKFACRSRTLLGGGVNSSRSRLPRPSTRTPSLPGGVAVMQSGYAAFALAATKLHTNGRRRLVFFERLHVKGSHLYINWRKPMRLSDKDSSRFRITGSATGFFLISE